MEVQPNGTITSPRELQEKTLTTSEGHDVTTKQYEDQLDAFRKEIFHLKLRVHFLEEKLGTGASPAVKGLLEHNVSLQVEVEELKRQLTDSQVLLSAAAEAIDLSEQQESISNDSIRTSMNITTVKQDCKDEIPEVEEKDETFNESPQPKSIMDLGVTVNNEELDELEVLRKENRKALQMIKSCIGKIQQQDTEIKKLKLDKELVYAHVSDSQLEKMEKILKNKDKQLLDLESKVKELQKNTESIQTSETAGNLQELLTRRLQGLALFLDKLLSHNCVLGEEKKKMAEIILEQSMALPVGLKLDESIAAEDFTMDESNLNLSQSMRIDDSTFMIAHHTVSESKCWSEPDRNVSLARVGLCDTGFAARESTSENNKHHTRRSRIYYGLRSEDNRASNEVAMLNDEITQLTKGIEELEGLKNDLNSQLDFAMCQIKELVTEKDELKAALSAKRLKTAQASKELIVCKKSISVLESNAQDVEQQLSEARDVIENLQIERQELESSYLENERSLRRAADEATFQAAQASEELIVCKNTISLLESNAKDVEQQLSDARDVIENLHIERQELESSHLVTERSLRRAADEATFQAAQAELGQARAQLDRLQYEEELDETRKKLDSVTEEKAQLELELAREVPLGTQNKIALIPEGEPSKEDRPTTPDQGIDSDRLSSLEHSVYGENVILKQKLARTKAALAETLAKLNAANTRKRIVQRAICREIHKTQGVLRTARNQLENQNS